MTEGGRFTKDTDHAIRYMALIVAPVFIVQSLLVMVGVIPSDNYIGPNVTLLIITLWGLVALYHMLAPLKSTSDILARFIVFEAMTLGTTMFVTGFYQPFVVVLALMFLAAHIYFGYRGLAISLLVVIAATLMDTLVRYPGQPEILPLNLIATVAVLVLAIIIIAIVTTQEHRHAALARAQRQERLQYDRIMTIMNNLADATFSTDSRGRVQMYNAACLNLLDTNDSLRGKQISDLFTLTGEKNKPVKLFDHLLKTATRTSRRDDITHTYSDGEQIRLDLTFAPIKSSYSAAKKGSHVDGYIVIARDVTKEKSLEEERDEFISVVSHELRTPITIVEGSLSNLQLLLKRPKSLSNKALATTVDSAHEQTLYLARMVNDLSTLSRAERGVADTAEDIDVTDLLHGLHQKYDNDARAKKLHLDLNLGAKLGTIHASRLYTEELLQNFITNALKYTHKGGVTIEASRKKDLVEFRISDTGIGISRGEQAKIFDKFYRSEDYRIRETNGTGLGLYVSAKLARKIGTQIELKSRLNHGSTFSFTLPIKKD